MRARAGSRRACEWRVRKARPTAIDAGDHASNTAATIRPPRGSWRNVALASPCQHQACGLLQRGPNAVFRPLSESTHFCIARALRLPEIARVLLTTTGFARQEYLVRSIEAAGFIPGVRFLAASRQPLPT